MDERIIESINRLSEQFEGFNDNLIKLNAALYDDEDNKQKGLITLVHEMKPQVETFSRYLQAREELRKTYSNIVMKTGIIVGIVGAVVTIIVSIKDN